jgi:hypothetical protein
LEMCLCASYPFDMSRILHLEYSPHAIQKYILFVTSNSSQKNESDQISCATTNHHLELWSSGKEIFHVEFLKRIGGLESFLSLWWINIVKKIWISESI